MTSNQPGLFDDIGALPPPSPELVALASRIPASIKFGTSTWTYDGWSGEVYHRAYRGAQPARRLEEYARYPLFRTVGIDRDRKSTRLHPSHGYISPAIL